MKSLFSSMTWMPCSYLASSSGVSPASPVRVGECTLKRRGWPLAVAIAIELGGGAVRERVGDELEADVNFFAVKM